MRDRRHRRIDEPAAARLHGRLAEIVLDETHAGILEHVLPADRGEHGLSHLTARLPAGGEVLVETPLRLVPCTDDLVVTQTSLAPLVDRLRDRGFHLLPLGTLG